jgi:hypothetical protein
MVNSDAYAGRHPKAPTTVFNEALADKDRIGAWGKEGRPEGFWERPS